MLSNTCKYAIRAVIYLAVHTKGDEKIGIKRIAEELQIPTPFLGKILQTLARTKVLSSTKGPHGGFGVGKDPSKVSLLELVEIIDGTDVFDLCIIGMKNCSSQEKHCTLHEAYSPTREVTRELFKRTSIEQLAAEIKKGNQSIII